MSEPLKMTLTPVQSAALHLAVMVSDPDTWNLSARDIDAITTVLRALPSVQPGPIASDDDVTALEQWADEAANQLWDGTPNIGTRLNRLHLLRRVARRLGETADYDVLRRLYSEAAREINCIGAVAHRIRVLKQHHARQIAELESQLSSTQADTRRLDQVEAIKPAIYQPTENDEVWKVVDVSDSYRTYSGPTLRGTIDVMLAAMETKK